MTTSNSKFYSDTAPNAPGIYQIVCIPTQKFYIGSAVNLRQRKKNHYEALQKGKHRNQKLQNSWNKYGEDSFCFKVMEIVEDKSLLVEREQFWLDELNPFFNIAPIAGSSLGQKRSPEARERMGIWQRGKPSARKGQKQPPEAVERQRRSLTGYKHTEEAKRNMANSHRGAKRNSETREKMRIAALGHTMPEKARTKFQEYNETQKKTLIFVSPDGTEHLVYGVRAFCKEHQLAISSIMQVAKGKQKQHRGWTARFPDATDS